MKLSAIASLLLLTVLIGCSSVKVDSDYDPKVDFTSLDSYAWLPEPRAKTGNPRLDNPLLTSRIEQAIEASLAAKGLSKVDAATADFFVTFHIAIDQKLDVTTIPTTYGYYGRWGGFYGGSETRVDQYDEGTLLIDFIDRDKDDLLWRGSGQSRIRPTNSPEEREKKVRTVVDAILERFPPKR